MLKFVENFDKVDNSFAIQPYNIAMSSRENLERRMSVRRATSENVYLYCKQLEIERCRPTNISSRGVYIDRIPKRAYVGRRIQLVFVINRGRTAKMIRVFAVIAHISRGGIGFGFIGKHIPNKRGDGAPRKLIP